MLLFHLKARSFLIETYLLPFFDLKQIMINERSQARTKPLLSLFY